MNSARGRGAGQAATEYVVILALTTIVLVAAAIEPSPIQGLIDAIKSAFAGFSYAISFSV